MHRVRPTNRAVVAGGGPTGVEVAGMLAEMRKNIGLKDYPELTGMDSKIYLVKQRRKKVIVIFIYHRYLKIRLV